MSGSDDILLNVGVGGKTVRADAITYPDGSIVYIPESKLVTGGNGIDGGEVTAQNPLPVVDATFADMVDLLRLLCQRLGAIPNELPGDRLDVGLPYTSDSPLPVLVQRPDRVVTALLQGPLNICTPSIAMDGYQSLMLQVEPSGTLVGTLTPEYSFDGGLNYSTAGSPMVSPFANVAAATLTLANPNALTNRILLLAEGVTHVRVRLSANTSGKGRVSLRASNVANQRAITLGAVSGAAAAGAALSGNPVLVGGGDLGGSAQTMPVAGTNNATLATGGVASLSGSQTYSVQASATVIASGSDSIRILFGTEVTVSVVVTGSVTGTGQTLQYTINEISIADGATVVRRERGPIITAAGSGAHRFTMSGMKEGIFQVTWAVAGSSPSFGSVSMSIETNQTTNVTPAYSREYNYGATFQSFTIAAAASGTKSLLSVFQSAGTSVARINIHRVTATAAGGTGTGFASLTFALRRITAIGSGGSTVVPQASCLDNPASIATVTTGATGTSGVGVDRWAEEVQLAYGRTEFDAVEHGGPLECRPGVSEGWEVIAKVNGTIAQDVHVTVSVDWTEITGLARQGRTKGHG